MPSTYAHYKFGQKVLESLREDIKIIINENIDLFNIGLHGPDIFFYYNAIIPNKINKIGHKLHKENAGAFFENSKSAIHESNCKTASLSYILGFICHYVLDNQCHGYIEGKVKNQGLSHSEIEVEFDRSLLIKDGYDPFKYEIVSHIDVKDKYSDIISKFYDNTDNIIVKKSILDFIKYNKILYLSGKRKQKFLLTVLKIIKQYDQLKGMFMNYNPSLNCEDTSKVLMEKFNNSINIAVKLIEEFYHNCFEEENLKLSDDFNKTFLGEESCE